jgi:dipeptidyl aminopeptidase/acylaminoacyl peptidase
MLNKMNRKKYLLVLVIISPVMLYGQESGCSAVITKTACENWDILREIDDSRSSMVNNDGDFFAYKHGSELGQTLVVRSIDGKFIREFYDAEKPVFGEKIRSFYCLVQDSLMTLDLSTKRIDFIPHIKDFATVVVKGKEMLIYLKKTGEFVINNLSEKKIINYNNVSSYFLNAKKNQIIIQSAKGVMWRNLITGTEECVTKDTVVYNLIFDDLGKKIAFFLKNDTSLFLCYYGYKKHKISIIANNDSWKIDGKFTLLNDRLKFSNDGTKLFFRAEDLDNSSKYQQMNLSGFGKVDIWSFNDKVIMSKQLKELKDKKTPIIMVAFDTEKNAFYRIGSDKSIISYNFTGNRFVLALDRPDEDEAYWRPQNQYIHLISTNTGKDTIVKDDRVDLLTDVKISPDEKFVVWFDKRAKAYFSYNVYSKIISNITKDITTPLYDDETLYLARELSFGLAGWSAKDNSVFLYDRYDIWKVDLNGITKPVNVTNGFGKLNHIIFRRLNSFEHTVKNTSKEIIVGFNRDNKNNGFWRKNFFKSTNPEFCTMGPYFYSFSNISPDVLTPPSLDQPQPVQHGSAYIVRRMSVGEAPNLFYTKNFKSFRQLTFLKPERSFPWLNSELVKYRLDDGNLAEGILYKPNNLDTFQKYPVIFHYYERRSDELNIYKEPKLSRGDLNIPWYVSRGYLVFIPNIYNKVGQPATGATSSVLSAVKCLSVRNYIDIARMGLQGHSFGGYQTLNIICRTNIFKAAQESAGVSDPISHFNDDSNSWQSYYEVSQGNFRTTPWDNPTIYIENSPVNNANKVRTPVLMMHNKGDFVVSFSQAVEFYKSLRRLKKACWLLQYDNEFHGISDEENQLDFTIRQQQFFDHYLKGAPAPIWMTRGIKAIDKGKATGYELDTEIKTPGPGLVTSEEQQKIDDYSKIPLEEKLRKMVEKQ